MVPAVGKLSGVNPKANGYLAVVCLCIAQAALAGRVTWLLSEGGNGHAYELIVVQSGITWSNASVAATNLGGHLATAISSNENAFIFFVAQQDTNAWYGGYGPWLGGYQPAGAAEPAGGWAWVTREPFTFQNWAPNQPNNNGGEDRIHFGGRANPSDSWNDLGQNATNFARGFVVEYYPPPVVVAISSSATGSPAPEQAMGIPVTNGNFLITNCCPNRPTGDGKDEFTLWTFDFTAEPALEQFLHASELSSALLSLTLTTGSSLITSDAVRIEPLADIRPPILRTLSLGVTTNIDVELLDYYPGSDILNVLRTNNGRLPMLYHEDALVFFARLILAQPEVRLSIRRGPASILQLCWPSELNRTYSVQYQTNLAAPGALWLDLGSPIIGNGSTNCIITTRSSPARFYRVVRDPLGE